eukprot:3171296-Rhodomonas_salina.1
MVGAQGTWSTFLTSSASSSRATLSTSPTPRTWYASAPSLTPYLLSPWNLFSRSSVRATLSRGRHSRQLHGPDWSRQVTTTGVTARRHTPMDLATRDRRLTERVGRAPAEHTGRAHRQVCGSEGR